VRTASNGRSHFVDGEAELVGRLTRQVQQLEAALLSNRRIGVAMGIIMARTHMTVDEAFDELRVASQNSNRKLRDVAEDVIYEGCPPASTLRARRHQNEVDEGVPGEDRR